MKKLPIFLGLLFFIASMSAQRRGSDTTIVSDREIALYRRGELPLEVIRKRVVDRAEYIIEGYTEISTDEKASEELGRHTPVMVGNKAVCIVWIDRVLRQKEKINRKDSVHILVEYWHSEHGGNFFDGYTPTKQMLFLKSNSTKGYLEPVYEKPTHSLYQMVSSTFIPNIDEDFINIEFMNIPPVDGFWATEKELTIDRYPTLTDFYTWLMQWEDLRKVLSKKGRSTGTQKKSGVGKIGRETGREIFTGTGNQ